MSNIHRKYSPRNIINAPDVKSAIISRSEQRDDGSSIQRWLSNHFSLGYR